MWRGGEELNFVECLVCARHLTLVFPLVLARIVESLQLREAADLLGPQQIKGSEF